jgi:hypothetical protein
MLVNMILVIQTALIIQEKQLLSKLHKASKQLVQSPWQKLKSFDILY